MKLDLDFRLQSFEPIPADHGYALYAAISRLVPAVHADNAIAVHPIGGRLVGDRQLMLMPSALVWSRRKRQNNAWRRQRTN